MFRRGHEQLLYKSRPAKIPHHKLHTALLDLIGNQLCDSRLHLIAVGISRKSVRDLPQFGKAQLIQPGPAVFIEHPDGRNVTIILTVPPLNEGGTLRLDVTEPMRVEQTACYLRLDYVMPPCAPGLPAGMIPLASGGGRIDAPSRDLVEARAVLRACADLIGSACPDASVWTDGLAEEVDRVLGGGR